MKKLFLVLALATISNASFSQERILDSVSEKKIENAVDGLYEWQRTTKSIKRGGYDRECIGILENIFSDADAKYEYALINPDIAKLEITCLEGGPYMFETCTYDKWLNSIETIDTSLYKTKYRSTSSNVQIKPGVYALVECEILHLINLETGSDRCIAINYYNNSIRSITDSNLSLYK